METVNQRETGFWELLEAFQSVSVERSNLSVKAVNGAIHGLVIDNGRGFVFSQRDRVPGHLGLLALNGRCLPAVGRTRIEREPGLGTKIAFSMPVL